jgi:phage terminase small subunit
MAGSMKLTPKQARFVQEYLIDLNAAQAAIRAGYSAKTARVIGHENLTKPDIAAAIEKARTKRAERLDLTGDMVIDELRKIGFANMADYMKPTPEGDPCLDFSGLTRDQTAALSQVTVESGPAGKRVTFKLLDKLGALDKLGRHLGIFERKHKQPDTPVEVDIASTRRQAVERFTTRQLDRCLRDILTANQHVVATARTYEMAGRLLLGLEPLRWLF